MKTLRLLLMLVITVLMFSLWGPAPVYAGSPSLDTASVSQTIVAAAAKTATLTVDNRTGGTLYVKLTGPKYYSFAAPKQGKTTFSNIEVGKYTITVSTSKCKGSMTFSKNLKGKESLKPFVCR